MNNDKSEINLFVYGTLQHGQSRNYILGGLTFEKAILPEYKKVQPPNLGFPFIIRSDGSVVEGEVYYNLDPLLLSELDIIEGEGSLYHRIVVEVKTESNKIVKAFTYYPSEKLISSFISYL